jgi:putative SOS response-associated peptidase YedK
LNIAPGQPAAVVRQEPGAEGRELTFLRWGLIPAWADDPSIGDRLANARSETAATKPSFRRAFRSRRCLVVADGFYEWQKTNGRKQPYFIGLKSDRPFGLAGLWERWEKHGEPVESCTILWHDPQARRLCVLALDTVPAPSGGVAKPVMCPKCTGVFAPWQEGERQKTCIHCGHAVALA